MLVYTSKGLAWFGAVVVLSKQAKAWCGAGAKQTNQARAWSILQPKVWCLVLWWVRCWSILQPSAKLSSKGAGLSILQPKAWLWCGRWVRCGYILHPSSSLVLGLVLRERIKSKEIRSKDNKLRLDIPYTSIVPLLLDPPASGRNIPIYGKGLRGCSKNPSSGPSPQRIRELTYSSPYPTLLLPSSIFMPHGWRRIAYA